MHHTVESFMTDFQVNSTVYLLQYSLLDCICNYTNPQVFMKRYAPTLVIRDFIGNDYPFAVRHVL